VVGGGLSAVVQLSLGNALVPTFHAPPFTLAFNVTMLLFVLGTHTIVRCLVLRATPASTCTLPDVHATSTCIAIHRLHTACALPSCTAHPLTIRRRHPSL
jgi:hypothetical protein